MSIGTEFKQYSGSAAEQGKNALSGVRRYVFATVGAGDVLVTRATQRGRRLASRTQAIATGRVTPTDLAADVRKSVEGYLQSAGEQAANTYVQLSKRGEEVVHELRKDPRLQKVIFRAERAVDTVEDRVDDLLDDVAETVDTRVDDAKDALAEGADATRAAARQTAARNTNARKSTTRKTPNRKAPARNPAALKAPIGKASPVTSPRKASARKPAARTSTARKAATKAVSRAASRA